MKWLYERGNHVIKLYTVNEFILLGLNSDDTFMGSKFLSLISYLKK